MYEKLLLHTMKCTHCTHNTWKLYVQNTILVINLKLCFELTILANVVHIHGTHWCAINSAVYTVI